MGSVTPCLWFNGNAEAAARFYATLLPNSRILSPEKPTPEGQAEPLMVIFEIDGLKVQGLNGGPSYQLSPAFSFSVSVDGQQEVDRLWNALTADGGEESMCGWLVDRFGVSWQIVPKQLMEFLSAPDREAAMRAQQAMLKMRKIDIAALARAFNNEA